MREFAELDAGVCALTAGATLGGRDALFEVLAAILHLGDVAFEGEDKAVLDAAGQKALDAAAAALQYTPGELLLQLTERWIAAGPSEEICITLAPAEARQVRDAVAKAIYQRLFLFYVEQLNAQLSPAALRGALGTPRAVTATRRGSLQRAMSRSGLSEKVVGLLDIFGFESLAVNGLEQICINLANERLHSLFLSYVFHGLPPSQVRVRVRVKTKICK